MLCAQRLWSKHVWFEESTGVPFLIKYGDRFIKGRTDNVLNGVDIMPTILSLMNLPIPETVEGTDLKEVVLNGGDVENYAIMTGYPGQMRAIEEFKKPWKRKCCFWMESIRTKTHTYVINRAIHNGTRNERLLYDNINRSISNESFKIK